MISNADKNSELIIISLYRMESDQRCITILVGSSKFLLKV